MSKSESAKAVAWHDHTSRAVADIASHPDTVLEVMPRDLADQEQSTLRRISPFRSRWPELAEIDAKVAEYDHRRVEVSEELQRTRQQRNQAPEVDARRLADWIAAGSRGDRPEPSAPELDSHIAELEREHDALLRAADVVLEDKVHFVEKHRKRLVRDADSRVTQLRERYETLVGELAATREEMAATRQAALFAALYPARGAGVAPPATVAGGRRQVLEQAGITAQLDPGRLWDLLRADAEYLTQAATGEQREEMGAKRPDEAVWSGTPEGQEREREERKQALARYKSLWGREPV